MLIQVYLFFRFMSHFVVRTAFSPLSFLLSSRQLFHILLILLKKNSDLPLLPQMNSTPNLLRRSRPQLFSLLSHPSFVSPLSFFLFPEKPHPVFHPKASLSWGSFTSDSPLNPQCSLSPSCWHLQVLVLL